VRPSWASVAACLARLSRDAMASSGYGMAPWRGLRISFSAKRKWRQITPIATISAGTASLAIELNPAWTAKGQYWRIEKEPTASADGASAAAQRLRVMVRPRRDVGIPSGRMLAPLATVRALPTVSSRLTGQLQDPRGRWGNVALYQLPDQNALHNGTRAVRRKGTGWARSMGRRFVTGGAQDHTVVNAAQLVSGTHTSAHA
jgi:hypothetical protein